MIDIIENRVLKYYCKNKYTHLNTWQKSVLIYVIYKNNISIKNISIHYSIPIIEVKDYINKAKIGIYVPGIKQIINKLILNQ